jgi:hypothetical protein
MSPAELKMQPIIRFQSERGYFKYLLFKSKNKYPYTAEIQNFHCLHKPYDPFILFNAPETIIFTIRVQKSNEGFFYIQERKIIYILQYSNTKI